MKYYKIVKIKKSEYVKTTGDTNPRYAMQAKVVDKVCYLAINEKQEYTLSIDLEFIEEAEND